MKTDAWKNFEASGKVLDYLAYRKGAKQDAKGAADCGAFLEKGMGGYGTEHSSDGNGVARHADWGL